MSFEATALLLAWVVIVLLAFAMSGLLRQVHALTVRERLPRAEVGPQIGAPAPNVLPDRADPSRPAALLFADAGCESCSELLGELRRVAASGRELDLAVVFPGGANGFASDGLTVLTRQAALFDRLQVPVTPFAVLIGGDGRVAAAEPVGSVNGLNAFLAQADREVERE